MKMFIKVLSWIVVVALALVVLSSLTSCEKETVYTESCVDYELTYDNGELNLNDRVVIYFKYDRLVPNTLFHLGIGDTMMIVTGSNIVDKVRLSEVVDILNSQLCTSDYYTTNPQSFEDYIKGSSRFEVFKSNANGDKKNDISTWTTNEGRVLTGVRPDIVYSLSE